MPAEVALVWRDGRQPAVRLCADERQALALVRGRYPRAIQHDWVPVALFAGGLEVLVPGRPAWAERVTAFRCVFADYHGACVALLLRLSGHQPGGDFDDP